MHIVQACAFGQPPLTQASALSPVFNRRAYRLSCHGNVSVTRPAHPVKRLLNGAAYLFLTRPGVRGRLPPGLPVLPHPFGKRSTFSAPPCTVGRVARGRRASSPFDCSGTLFSVSGVPCCRQDWTNPRRRGKAAHAERDPRPDGQVSRQGEGVLADLDAAIAKVRARFPEMGHAGAYGTRRARRDALVRCPTHRRDEDQAAHCEEHAAAEDRETGHEQESPGQADGE